LPAEYSRVLSQRNEALRRARTGVSTRSAVEPWTAQLAELGSELDRARAELARLLGPGFAEHSGGLGLAAASLAYEEQSLALAELEARLERDLERGRTGVGPHLRDLEIRVAGRDLRSFGSQGEQRTGVLALLLAEAALLEERRGSPPLLLLDDVFSELDERRRLALVTSLPEGSQTFVTMTDRSAYPAGAPDPALVVSVRREEDASLAEAA
jgi:DNA replication and repair protein RecF